MNRGVGMVVEEMATSLPVVGETTETVWEAVSGGQPICLTRKGQPAVVVIDLDTYAAWEETTGVAP